MTDLTTTLKGTSEEADCKPFCQRRRTPAGEPFLQFLIFDFTQER